MKKVIFFFAIMVTATMTMAQRYQDPTLHAKAEKRQRIDSTDLFPTGCGAPWNLSTLDKAQKHAARYFDSCNHRFYVYDPKLDTWDTLRVGPSFGGVDVLDSISAIDAYSNAQSKTFIVKDSLRGGIFLKYDGSYPADGGMIFEDGLAQKWIRQTQDNSVNIQWYGAKASNTGSTNRDKIIAARDFIYNHWSKGTIFIPADTTGGGGYYISDSLLFNKSISIVGEGTIAYPKPVLVFPVDKSGLVFKYLYGESGFSVKLKNFKLVSQQGGSGPYYITRHAIFSNTFIDVDNVEAYSWGGDGIHIDACATAPSGENNNYGNASLSVIKNFIGSYCTYGIFTSGCDANSILIENPNTSQNRRAGIFLNGQLGDVVIKPHAAFNGVPAVNGGNSVVEYGGKYYMALPGYDGHYGDALDSNFNKPPEDSTAYWKEVGFMTSTVWNDSTRYYSGGPLIVRNANAWTNILHAYTEAFQPPIILNYRSKVDGGDNGAGVYSGSYDLVLDGERKILNSNLVIPNINEIAKDTVQKHITIGKQTTDAAAPLTVYNDYTRSAILATTKFETTGTGLYAKFKNQWTEGHLVYNIDSWLFQTNGFNNRLIIDATGTYPDSDSSRDLGTSSAYWKRAYAKRYYGDLRTATNMPFTFNTTNNVDANGYELLISNASQFAVESNTIDLYTPGSVNEMHLYDDSASFKKRVSYTSNIHSSFSQHSLIDKDYLDSMMATISTGLIVGTTTITGGTNTKVLYNNSGVVGEYTVSGSGNVAMTTSPVLTTPDLGTPSALVGTNITGTAASLTAGNATTLATSRNLNGAAFNGSANVLVPEINPSVMALLGSTILAEPITGDVYKTSSSSNLTDGQVRWVAIYIPASQTITGIKWMQQTQGSYTADNYNGVGLYSYSGGNLTLVASSTDDGNIWKATSFTWSSKAFSSTYNASPGIYFAALIYNSSAQTTAPALRANQLSSDLLNTVDFTNTAKAGASLTGQTTLPAGPTAMSTLATNSAIPYLALY